MGVGEASSGREEVEPRRLLSQWPSAPIDAIATRQIRERKAIRRSPAISAAKTFFFRCRARKNPLPGIRIKRLDRIRKQLIEIALSRTTFGLEAAFLRIFR